MCLSEDKLAAGVARRKIVLGPGDSFGWASADSSRTSEIFLLPILLHM